jgi:hypothetical protein
VPCKAGVGGHERLAEDSRTIERRGDGWSVLENREERGGMTSEQGLRIDVSTVGIPQKKERRSYK